MLPLTLGGELSAVKRHKVGDCKIEGVATARLISTTGSVGIVGGVGGVGTEARERIERVLAGG